MRLIHAVLAVSLTPAFVALPTVSFAAPDKPRPVTPKVVSMSIRGIDARYLAGSSTATDTNSGATQKGTTAGATARVARGHRVSPVVVTGEQATKPFTVAGVSWATGAGVDASEVSVRMRVRENAGWSTWESLAIPDDGPDGTTGEAAKARVGTTPLVTGGADAVQVRVDTPDGKPLPDLKVTTIDPGTSPADDDLAPQHPASASAAAVQPTIITRAQWGADESLRGSTTLNTTVKAITIHHTAGTNDYTEATAAAQVRGIYAYDTMGLGWSDIAYNFLVDKWGRVYEGRAGSITLPVRGAHAMGFNTDTMGVSAIGNYETTTAPAVMVDALARVAGWKLSQYGVDPLGTTQLTSAGGTGTKYAAGTVVTLPTVHAHQNTSYTLCPGKYLYPQMDTIRSKAAMYAKYSSTTGPLPVTTAGLYAAYGSLTLANGSTGYPVRDLQLELNRRRFSVGTADGAYGAMTTSAVTAFQKAKSLVVTGKVAANDWKALSGLAYTPVSTTPAPSPTPAPVAGWNADGRGDVMGRVATGDLYYYPTGVGTIGKPVRLSSGWNQYTRLLSPGDWTGDRRSDVLGLRSTGELVLSKGNGVGGFTGSPVVIARGWSAYSDLLAPGDWNGDHKPDLLARKTNGELWLVTGNGVGGFSAAARRIGTGWQMFTQLVTPGDVTGDGRPDLLGRTPAGTMYLYAGTGTGTGYKPGTVLSRGWQMYNTVFSTGDLTGDGRADLIARTPLNHSFVYTGNGKGGFGAAKAITAPWGAVTRIFGVR
ncbi:FG-GAP-like repeat-containing protein [Pedococcus sp. 5OH_020]|uniref:FG-GAP-like repeat-containing protein n=1 Tax=Pedococcus sp. 5OH_020 TaxID=2989814 RepID=UPI0022E9C479|nr:FG-GAP-like repeat-containing protein [Pedococcus sp. 5OH_020]